jgi:hypothetical protein
MSGDMGDCAMFGANKVLHLHEGTAIFGADTLVTIPF